MVGGFAADHPNPLPVKAPVIASVTKQSLSRTNNYDTKKKTKL
jgi:hypothetical protein